MPEPRQITFTFQEIAEMMVKKLNITEGLWGVYVNFGIRAANIGQDDTDLRPSAIVPVMELGLQRFDTPSNLTVDAAEVAAEKAEGPLKRAVAARKKVQTTRKKLSAQAKA